ncbi:MAG: hypothetical protein ACT452_21500 [Microthrixaceae bacterium]
MAQRVLAVLGAVGIVLLAVVVRSVIDDRGGSESRSEGNGDLVVACASELAAACQQLEGVTVVDEQAAVTAERIVDGSTAIGDVDAWVTTSAWIEVVDARAPGEVESQVAVASSLVVIATDAARADAVHGLCADAPAWRCLGDHAGAEWGALPGGDPRWGALKTGLPDADSAVGLPVLASVATGFFDSDTFATNDFDLSGLAGWLGRLAAPSGRGERDPVATLVTTRGKYTAVGDLQRATGERSVGLLAPRPEVRATVVLAGLAGGDEVPGLGRLREALVADGWEPADGATPPSPILKPGVMAALHTLWTETTR